MWQEHMSVVMPTDHIVSFHWGVHQLCALCAGMQCLVQPNPEAPPQVFPLASFGRAAQIIDAAAAAYLRLFTDIAANMTSNGYVPA